MHRVIFCAVFALAFGVIGEVNAQGTGSTRVCRISVKKQYPGFWLYYVEDCATGTQYIHNDDPNLPVGGDCSNSGTSSCFDLPNPTPMAMHYSKNFSAEKIEEIKNVYRKETAEMVSQLSKALGFLHQQIQSY